MKYPRFLMVSFGRPLLLASFLALVACATDTEPDNLRFGESVRHMISLQTTDPNSGARGLDGVKAEQAFRAYETDVAARGSVGKGKIGFSSN
jgi:hypothetical protein